MANAKDSEYFHIHRPGPYSAQWSGGATLEFRQPKKNQLLSFYDETHFQTANTPDGSPRLIMAALNALKDAEGKMANDRLLALVHDVGVTLKQELIFVREIIFEEIRVKSFNGLPSRQGCIWLSEKASVPYWWSILSCSGAQIFKVRVTGNVHIGAECFLNADSRSHNSFRDNARQYWSGVDNQAAHEREIIFEGTVKLIESYLTMEDFIAATS